jgi:hypothetical protein
MFYHAESENNMKYQTIEQITKQFIKDGWNKNTTFTELSLKEAEEKGYLFAVDTIKKGRKYFKMNISNNIFNDEGKIALYNIPCCK